MYKLRQLFNKLTHNDRKYYEELRQFVETEYRYDTEYMYNWILNNRSNINKINEVVR